MGISLKVAMGVAGLVVATQAAAQITLYSREDFRGEQFTTDRNVRNLDGAGFNDSASSAVVNGGQWQACEDAGFAGRCVILQPGEYHSLRDMGLSNEISSIRAVDSRMGYDDRRGERLAGGYDYHRRADERLFDAPVTSVHAVVGPPEERCWVERREIVGDSGGANVPGAIAGAVIGGILGHQIGGGHGRDAATVGGAVAGGAIGANAGRDGDEVYGRDVQQCATSSRNERPDYWDVTYSFRGQEHRVQTASPPGPTITVNADGEPRI
jgi:uncharacterized protein YcfJ